MGAGAAPPGRPADAPTPAAEDDDITFTEDDIKPDKLSEEEARLPLGAATCRPLACPARLLSAVECEL
jgi:hypothetical protein